MSTTYFRVIPTDPRWQPDDARAESARALVESFIARTPVPPGWPERREPEVAVHRFAAMEFVDCGGNLERIGCPRCGSEIDGRWWGDQLGERYDDGFFDLDVTAPCCGSTVGLDVLDYDWPCGFARFEIEACDPNRDPFDGPELAQLGNALGHPVRLVIAHM